MRVWKDDEAGAELEMRAGGESRYKRTQEQVSLFYSAPHRTA